MKMGLMKFAGTEDAELTNPSNEHKTVDDGCCQPQIGWLDSARPDSREGKSNVECERVKSVNRVGDDDRLNEELCLKLRCFFFRDLLGYENVISRGGKPRQGGLGGRGGVWEWEWVCRGRPPLEMVRSWGGQWTVKSRSGQVGEGREGRDGDEVGQIGR